LVEDSAGLLGIVAIRCSVRYKVSHFYAHGSVSGLKEKVGGFGILGIEMLKTETLEERHESLTFLDLLCRHECRLTVGALAAAAKSASAQS